MSDTPPAVGLQAGPCAPWCTVEDFRGGDPGCAPWNDATLYPPDIVEGAIVAASEGMFQLGGRRWPGVCSDTVLPERCIVAPPGRVHTRGWSCSGGRIVELGSYPVVGITEVKVDGVVLASSAYEVLDWRYLHRIDGDPWPCCNTRPRVGEPWRLEVTFTFGETPPALGQLATVALSRELAKGACTGDDCALDRRATQVAREGVTVTFPGLVDTLVASAGKGIGIGEVDLFMFAHNPTGLRRRGRLLIPGQADTAHRVTTPAT